MRTLKMIAMATMFVFLTAGFAVAADDISIAIDNENNIDVEGGDALAQQKQKQRQEQEQKQKQQLIFNEKTQLPHLQYGTNFVTPGIGIQNKGWYLYQSAVYAYLSASEVENMRRHFQLSDIFFWNWKTRMNVSMINARLPGKPEGISLMNYWPAAAINKGDKVIASITVRGDVNWPEESFLGMAAQVCIEEAGSDRFAVMYTISSKGITNGASVSIGGAVSQVASSGTKGAVVTSGGQLGTIETSLEDYKQFEVKCMNRGEVTLITFKPPVPPPAPPVVQPPAPVVIPCPPAEFVCDWTVYERRITALIEAVGHCKKPCLNNELLRKQIGDAYVQWFNCTGKTNLELLRKAAEHYAIGERDFLNGREPDGTKTRSMQSAQELVYQIRYNWSWCVYVLHSYEAEMAFASSKGLNSAPEHYEELKF